MTKGELLQQGLFGLVVPISSTEYKPTLELMDEYVKEQLQQFKDACIKEMEKRGYLVEGEIIKILNNVHDKLK